MLYRRTRLEQLEKLLSLRFAQILPDRVAQAHILLEIPECFIGVGAVPDSRVQIVLSAPGFEWLDLLRAAQKQELRWRKSIGIAPDRGQAIVGLVDEIAQIGGPAAVVVTEKEQALVVLHQQPTGEMDG